MALVISGKVAGLYVVTRIHRVIVDPLRVSEIRVSEVDANIAKHLDHEPRAVESAIPLYILSAEDVGRARIRLARGPELVEL